MGEHRYFESGPPPGLPPATKRSPLADGRIWIGIALVLVVLAAGIALEEYAGSGADVPTFVPTWLSSFLVAIALFAVPGGERRRRTALGFVIGWLTVSALALGVAWIGCLNAAPGGTFC